MRNVSEARRKGFVVRGVCSLLIVLLVFAFPHPSFGYSILAHQAIIDVVWESQLKPMLRAKFPRATEDDLNSAEAFAYGGSIIQDLGYYPYGSPFFSDLTHYVRSGDFVEALFRNSHDIDDYAFALGALAHYVTDTNGHPEATNVSVPLLYPKLQKKYGDHVTYEQDPLAHVKTEFGFDVLQVARGHYASDQFHDFIGFEVSQPLLDQAFEDTYGLKLKDVFVNEEKALNSYRRDVSKWIPKATRVAWTLKSDEIEAAQPGITHRKFLYNLSRSDYEKQYGKNYQKPSFSEKLLAFLYKLLPKFGPLKVLQLKMPTPETERFFEASFNKSVENYQQALAAVRGGTLKLENTNLDVGRDTAPGKYELEDKAQARLLHELAKRNFRDMTPEIRAELVNFFSDPGAPENLKKDAKTWQRTQAELVQLKQAKIGPGAPAKAARVPWRDETNVSLR